MTYDKLLARIDNELAAAEHDAICNSGGQIEAVKALRAVVELHRPEAQEHGQYEKCWNCNLLYPCPTIQAIEKELG
jgi:hypothetical protein